MNDFADYAIFIMIVFLVVVLVLGFLAIIAEVLEDNEDEVETHVDPYWNIVCKTIDDETFCFAMEDLNVDY